MTLMMGVRFSHDLPMHTVCPHLEAEHGRDVRPRLRDALLRMRTQLERVPLASLDLLSDLSTQHFGQLVGLAGLQSALGHRDDGPDVQASRLQFALTVAQQTPRAYGPESLLGQRSSPSWSSGHAR